MRRGVKCSVTLPQMGSHSKAGWLHFPVDRQMSLGSAAVGGIW